MDFAHLKNTLQSWYGIDQDDGSDRLPDPVASSLLNWAQKEYLRNRESRFGETGPYTFSTVVNQRDYILVSDLSKPGSLYYFNPDNGTPTWIELITKADFDKTFPGSVAYATGGPYVTPGFDSTTILGDPTKYTIWNQRILLGKVPNRVLTLFQDYWRYLPDLVNPIDSNLMTQQADQYLIFKALAGVHLFGIDDDRVPMWEAAARQLEGNLDSEDIRRFVAGRVSQSREPG